MSVRLPFGKDRYIVVFDIDRMQPVMFLEDGVWYQVVGSCNECSVSTKCCLGEPPYPEFANEEGKCKFFKIETVNGKKVGRCEIHRIKPLACALFPSTFKIAKDKILPECQLKVRRM